MITSIIAVAALATVETQQRVEVPFRVAENAIIVDAVVNGVKVSAMFDSGFSGAFVLDPNMNVGEADGTMNLRDFVGQFEAKTVSIKSLEFGNQRIDPAGMSVVQMPGFDLTESYGVHCDGIMGLEVLAHHILEINFERERFIFHPRSHDISQMTPDNERTWLLRMLPMGNNAIKLLVNTEDGKSMIMALDTGNAFYATTHVDVLERIGKLTNRNNLSFQTSAMVASGPVDSYFFNMKNLKIYDVPVENSVWSIIDLPSSDANHDGTVGFGFLKHFNITIDLERRRVWLENFSGRVVDEPMADIGILGYYDERTRRMRVGRVTPGSPADRAGIRPGDDILGIDGSEARRMTFREFRALMEGEVGSTVVLSLSRGGRLQRYELERAYLINNL